MKRYSILVNGRVQGVGFRFFANSQAIHLRLTGWVKNLDNGMVQIEVQGSDERISLFLDTIKKGNMFIRVDGIKKEEIPLSLNEKNFKTLN